METIMKTKSWRKRLDDRLAGKTEEVKDAAIKTFPSAASKPFDEKPDFQNIKKNIHSLKTDITYNYVNEDPLKKKALIEDLKRNISENKTMNTPSLIPPSIEPPKIPKSRAADLYKHNVRAYVIGFCFIWGTLLGFLYHISRDEPIKQEENNEIAKPAKTKTDLKKIISQKPHKDNKTDQSIARRKGDIPFNIEKPSATIKSAKQELDKIDMTADADNNTAKTPSLPKFRYGGISGRNAPLIRSLHNRNKSTGTLRLPENSIESSDFSGPELD